MGEETFDERFEEVYEVVQACLDRSSTTGYPYRTTFSTNGELLEQKGEEVKERVRERCKAIYFGDGDYSEYLSDRVRWLEEGLRDPVRVFAKRQALPRRKALPRVISQVSVVDQLVERIFFQGFTDKEGESYPNLPSKKGIGFSAEHAALIGEGVRTLSERTGLQPIASDVAGWEKNYSFDLATAHAELMVNCLEHDDEGRETTRKAANWWSRSLMSTPYVLDNGDLIDFDDLLVQRSGDFLTTSANGSGRGFCAVYVGSAYVDMGDDCLEWSKHDPETLIEKYREIGLPVRDVVPQRGDSFLFCSHRFERASDGSWVCWLETWERMLYEASFSDDNTMSTNLNYRTEIEQMPPTATKARILRFLSARSDLLGAVARHDEQEESFKNHDPGFQERGHESGHRGGGQLSREEEEEGAKCACAFNWVPRSLQGGSLESIFRGCFGGSRS